MKGAPIVTDWSQKTFVLHDSKSYALHVEEKCSNKK